MLLKDALDELEALVEQLVETRYLFERLAVFYLELVQWGHELFHAGSCLRLKGKKVELWDRLRVKLLTGVSSLILLAHVRFYELIHAGALLLIV